MAQRQKPNFRSNNNKRSGKPKGVIEQVVDDLLRPSKGQDSRKVHDTKGKNSHGRRSW